MAGERSHSLPPSYSEAVGIPPPDYTETSEQGSRSQENVGPPPGSNIVHPAVAWTNQNTIITQPRPMTDISATGLQTQLTQLETDHRKTKGCLCNAYCVACKNKPCTIDGECFCYNCLAFGIYAMTCGPGTLVCMCCKKVCPETYGDCPSRQTSLNESFLFRDDSFVASCCWYLCGPVCCMTCDESTDVCPLATPCKEHCGMPCMRKMTCYCGGNSLSDYRCSPMDQHACGFLWDCKQVDCKLYN